MNEPTQEALLSRDGPRVTQGGMGERASVLGGEVRQRTALEVTPEVLHRIQLRGIGRQQDRLDLRAALEERRVERER